MVIAKIEFGLANQMFQYAAGRALSLRNNQPLKLDLSFFDQINSANRLQHEEYGMHLFKGASRIESVTNEALLEIYAIRKKYEADLFYKYLNRAKKLLRLKPYFACCWEKEYLKFDPINLHKKANLVYLHGYYQNEKNFSDFKQEISDDFVFEDNVIDKLNYDLAAKMQNEQSVAIHIRRGDFIGERYVAPVSYYNEAIAYMLLKLNRPSFYVFSDDPEWAKDNIKTHMSCSYITHNNAYESYRDMYLMSKCQHNIIANSSFSWWGAWLNRNKGKIIISPKKWIPEEGIVASYIIPDSWVQL